MFGGLESNSRSVQRNRRPTSQSDMVIEWVVIAGQRATVDDKRRVWLADAQ